MTNLKTIDYSRITGYLCNYDTLEQYLCLQAPNGSSRPLSVLQECLLHFDDFLLPCNVPILIVKPLAVIKHLVSAPLDDKEKLYYSALSKKDTHTVNSFWLSKLQTNAL